VDLLSTGINALVVGAVGLILAWLGKGRFDAIDRQFYVIDRRFEAVDHWFDVIDHRFEAVDGRFDVIDHRFEAVDGRFDAVDRRFDVIDRRFEAVDGRFGGIEARIDHLGERLETRMDSFQASLDAMRSDLTQVALAVGARQGTGNA
jgi:hypothetical protein